MTFYCYMSSKSSCIKICMNQPQAPCNCDTRKELERALNETKVLRSELEKFKNQVKSLKEFKELKQSENIQNIEVQVVKPREVQRPSVITFKCKECSFTTKMKNTLKSHKQIPAENKCDICGVLFNSNGVLYQHMCNEHKDRLEQFNCNQCGFQSSTNTEFANHIQIHVYFNFFIIHYSNV